MLVLFHSHFRTTRKVVLPHNRGALKETSISLRARNETLTFSSYRRVSRFERVEDGHTESVVGLLPRKVAYVRLHNEKNTDDDSRQVFYMSQHTVATAVLSRRYFRVL